MPERDEPALKLVDMDRVLVDTDAIAAATLRSFFELHEVDDATTEAAVAQLTTSETSVRMRDLIPQGLEDQFEDFIADPTSDIGDSSKFVYEDVKRFLERHDDAYVLTKGDSPTWQAFKGAKIGLDASRVVIVEDDKGKFLADNTTPNPDGTYSVTGFGQETIRTPEIRLADDSPAQLLGVHALRESGVVVELTMVERPDAKYGSDSLGPKTDIAVVSSLDEVWATDSDREDELVGAA